MNNPRRTFSGRDVCSLLTGDVLVILIWDGFCSVGQIAGLDYRQSHRCWCATAKLAQNGGTGDLLEESELFEAAR